MMTKTDLKNLQRVIGVRHENPLITHENGALGKDLHRLNPTQGLKP